MEPGELKTWRQTNKIPLERIAAAANVGRETVRNWERGLVAIPDTSAEVIKLMMKGELKWPARKVNLAGVSDLDLLKELELRARRREAEELGR